MILLDLVFMFFLHTPKQSPLFPEDVQVQQVKDEDPVVFPEPSCFGPKGQTECY